CINQPEDGILNYTSRSPCGVAGIIVPWNLPLYLLTFKLGPALAYGNTVVAKPSEFTSVTAWMLCSLIKEAGIPDGVVNMVFGYGPRAGEALIRHPDTSLITFTGSDRAGLHIAEVAGAMAKKVSLEVSKDHRAIYHCYFQDSNRGIYSYCTDELDTTDNATGNRITGG
ncbi:Aldehyde dehydrogenase family 8 member A1, partial [Araneus ventricosus]